MTTYKLKSLIIFVIPIKGEGSKLHGFKGLLE